MNKEENVESQRKIIFENVTKILHDIGIPAKLQGYTYLREAIVIVSQDITLLRGITKYLYPNLAEKFKSKPSQIERGMRHAIEVAWIRGNIQNIDKIFGYTVSPSKGRPTNSEFIAMVSDKVRIDMGMI